MFNKRSSCFSNLERERDDWVESSAERSGRINRPESTAGAIVDGQTLMLRLSLFYLFTISLFTISLSILLHHLFGHLYDRASLILISLVGNQL